MKTFKTVIIMKRYFNIFYTLPFKTFFVVLLILCSWFMNTELTNILSLYKQDKVALINVFIQGEDYNYESSYFLKNSIETAIEDVIEYSLVYNRKADKAYTQYDTTATQDYNALVSRLKSLENFRFAIVNHKTDIIVSNISALNGKSPEATVRQYFGEDENILIVRDAKTPIFESGTMSEYVEFVGNQAKKYPDDFDLYISFGNNLNFAGSGEVFSQRHFEVLSAVESILKSITAYLVVLFILFVSLITVSGKKEPGGKAYPSLNDRLPNDLTFLLYLIVYISMSALYENSLYMALRVTNKDDFWLIHSPEFYMVRSSISMVVMTSVITTFCCTVKRQLRCGTLLSNTYIYKIIKNYKKADPGDIT